MSFIHNKGVNLFARTLLKPFAGIIPKKYHFAINGTITVDLGDDKKMLFHSNPTSNVFNMLFWGGIKGFEYNEFKVFTKLVSRSKLFLDIGANIGYYSCVAKKFNPNIVVYGFEPMPSASKYFKNNCIINDFDDIKVHQTALTNFKGEATFHTNINPKFPNETDFLYGDNSLNSDATGIISRVELKVKTDTLDNFVADNLKSVQVIDLIKLDTEGTENLVLEGATHVLSKHRPIIMCEVIKGFIEKQMEVILNSNDYLFYAVNQNGLIKVNSLLVEKGKLDFFFVPKEKESLVAELLSSK
ncbi:MAG: FkbM family methyltransferase [Bacteroidota bacterium]|nr:FkbM family methyltransferase [Bacteroidota bacterium]